MLPEYDATRKVAPAITALVVAALGVAAYFAADRLRELTWLRDLPRATSAGPGAETALGAPAIHAGKLHGPAGRATPAGRRAAAFWWAVAHRDDEGGSTVFCSARERSQLFLETASGTMRLAFTDADPAIVGLISDERTGEIEHAIAIDLGTTERKIHETLPAGTCRGENARYEELSIPEGAEVEVVGCAKEGVIEHCSSPPAARTPQPAPARRPRWTPEARARAAASPRPPAASR